MWVTVGGTAAQLGPDYSTTNLSFRGGTDYSITIDGGQVSKTVTLTPVFDEIVEGDETFTVVLRAAGDAGHDYTIGSPSAGEIINLDFLQLIFKDGFETPP